VKLRLAHTWQQGKRHGSAACKQKRRTKISKNKKGREEEKMAKRLRILDHLNDQVSPKVKVDLKGESKDRS